MYEDIDKEAKEKKSADWAQNRMEVCTEKNEKQNKKKRWHRKKNRKE
jgi:hypothetical protein